MNTSPSVMIAALFILLPLITISIMGQASAIEEAATFSQSVTGSGIATKAAAIQILTDDDKVDTSYTSSEFNEKFSNCGEEVAGVGNIDDMRVKTSENGCELQEARNGTVRLGIEVIENGEVRNEKVLIGYE